MAKLLISDFDGTLCDLKVNWDLLKKNLKIEFIDDVWKEEKLIQESKINQITKAEISGIEKINKLIYQPWNICKNWSILSSNSEQAISQFINICDKSILDFVKPDLIVGRETISGPKKNWDNFRFGVNKITSEFKINIKDCIYIGNEDYEKTFANLLGIKYFDIKNMYMRVEFY
jgi:hypothetical protein